MIWSSNLSFWEAPKRPQECRQQGREGGRQDVSKAVREAVSKAAREAVNKADGCAIVDEGFNA